jgi:hypothetical protein
MSCSRLAALLLAVLACVSSSGCAIVRWSLGGEVTRVTAPLPADFPLHGFSHAAFESLLVRYVTPEGLVDYAAWHATAADREQLDSYLAAVAAYSPDSVPARFPTASDRLVYWVQAYNAFVIKAVLERWPLDSVTDVKATIEFTRGFGFFYGLEFIAGGKRITLYDLEHDKLIRDDIDVRVHFVLNCGSLGCPAIRPELPSGDALELVLADAARDFVADPANAGIDHAARTLRLSPIFEWYASDFLADLRRRGLPAGRGIVDYILSISPEQRRAELERAAAYRIRYVEYDWDLNSAGGGS